MNGLVPAAVCTVTSLNFFYLLFSLGEQRKSREIKKGESKLMNVDDCIFKKA